MPRAILFDLDGTLMDTPLAIAEIFHEVLHARGHTGISLERAHATIGLPLAAALADLMELEQAAPAVLEAVSEYRRLYEQRIVPRAPHLLYPGVGEGLSRLRAHGLRLAVATSKITPAAIALLDAGGLLAHFETVIGADMVTHAKPDPEIGLLVLSRLDLPPEEAVMVGDTTHDLLMAQAAGMRSIGVTYGVHSRERLEAASPALVADDFPAVVEYLLSL